MGRWGLSCKFGASDGKKNEEKPSVAPPDAKKRKKRKKGGWRGEKKDERPLICYLAFKPWS